MSACSRADVSYENTGANYLRRAAERVNKQAAFLHFYLDAILQ